jgi:hypothetical protein
VGVDAPLGAEASAETEARKVTNSDPSAAHSGWVFSATRPHTASKPTGRRQGTRCCSRTRETEAGGVRTVVAAAVVRRLTQESVMLEKLDLEAVRREIDPDLMRVATDHNAVGLLLTERSPTLRGSADSPSLWARVRDQFRLFLCTDDKRYEELRNAFRKRGREATPALVGLLTGTIAAAVGGGVLLTILIPFVALLLYTAATIGVNAYCAAPTPV